MTVLKRLTILVLLLGATQVLAQNGPNLGYVYPAGGRQGTVVRVTVGGQLLRDPQGVYVSGAGVSAAVVEYVRPLSDQELGFTAWWLQNLVKKRWSAVVQAQAKTVHRLPDHPWLRDLDEQTPQRLAWLRARLYDPKKQPNAQLADQVEIEVTIDPSAPPGDRELRLVTANGLSNPLRFEVGALPEVREEDLGSASPPLDLPVVLNGQILPGATDRFRFRARAGQQLVVCAQARRLRPYLADAVPGWFQAAVALYDPQGRRVASAEHYGFDPDPVLHYTVPADGGYGLEIHDSIYRGREDFVYRVSVGELPFVTSIFPLGGPAGTPTVATVAGWNLPATTLTLDTRPNGAAIRWAHAGAGAALSNEVAYAVDTLPESGETEPNDSADHAQRVPLPQIVNGRIGSPGDVDVYSFEGTAGQEIVAEVWARRLGSPLDAALRLADATGATVAANDDHTDPEFGLLTHHADPYLRVKLPADGTYLVYVRDAQREGGEAYGYRLQLRPAQPDFALRVTPSSLPMLARRPAAVTVHALRKDGFDGDIDVVLQDAPAGFTLSRGRIPSGQDSVVVTLSAPPDAPAQLSPVRLEGRATIGGVAVTRPAVPAEDMMQAFAYRQLVPQQELLALVTGTRSIPTVWRPLAGGMTLASAAAVRLPLGGTAPVAITAPPTLPDARHSALASVHFALCSPPPGVRLVGARVSPTGVILTCKADANSATAGRTGHLLVEAYLELDGQPPARARQRVSLGLLPAIPFQIVAPGS
ncbi:MAG TPA: PPC domain-containing protein [Armatimonadota bacterium]|jgi:hypothetical protein